MYRSPVVTIRDMFRSDSAAAAIAESPRGGTITFIRYGVFAQYGAGDPIVVDANYVLFGNAEDYVFALGDGNRSCACTIVEYHTEPHIDALLSHRDPVLCSPRAYLMQARLLNDAWLRRADRNLDESASPAVVGNAGRSCRAKTRTRTSLGYRTGDQRATESEPCEAHLAR